MFNIILAPYILVLILFIIFGLLALIGLPVAFALGVSSVCVIILEPNLTLKTQCC